MDTIAAIATPPGQGGVGIVRVSGAKVSSIAKAILGHCPPSRRAEYLSFNDFDGNVVDKGIALYFKKPNSFTGEDVLELHGHGGQVVLDMLLQQTLMHGARIARAGEFTERAFINDKLDLAQAEAVADLIAAESEDAARAAMRSLIGEFSASIHLLVEQLIELRMHVEAALDFPEEEIDFIDDKFISEKLDAIKQGVVGVLESARQGCLLKEGMTVVIAGKPNAGKSSLLNRLAESETAIVTDIPGTTRDVLREHIQIDGLPLHIIDTAGLRETDNVIELEGVRRAWKEIEKCDRLLYVIDSQTKDNLPDHIYKQIPEHIGLSVVYNKTDLSGEQNRIVERKNRTDIYLSAKNGHGVDLLRRHLKKCMGYERHSEGQFIARRRHITAIINTSNHLIAAAECLQNRAAELMAEDLKLAQQELSSITGEFTSDDLLGRIFSDFCIGK
ncbi:MAG: tRNA uridine-5-carboxymethylaminomethyl(34) synthesis GTPase MnmE [Gammaproteobacteria bacterium]|nr:tRNA uridine-5-carboxymethylaminomethyl(34) synthesis GTPase MnmE [Gammaproteobacteria bacterium]